MTIDLSQKKQEEEQTLTSHANTPTRQANNKVVKQASYTEILRLLASKQQACFKVVGNGHGLAA
jgi:hypothetical protein